MFKYDIAKRKKTLEFLKNKKRFVERSPFMKLYFQYLNLSPIDRESQRVAWDEYYEQCKQSLAAKGFKAMRDAFLANDMEKVKKISDWSRKQRDDHKLLPKPAGLDPYEFENKQTINDYHQLCQKIKDMEVEVDFESSVEEEMKGSKFNFG